MKIGQEKVWAGTEQSLQAALEAEEGVATRLTAGQYPEDDEDEGKPYLLEVNDGVATVSIKGPLNNDSGFWNQYFGMTGYPDIRDAMLAAAYDPEVKQILLDIDSGGGAVSGVEDTAKLIRMINDQVKPVTAYTDGAMASAAYWLGSSAGKVYAGKTAVVGSIGVISTHMERSKQLAENGIGVTVVRAGKFKALANSVEKLTAEGKAQIQAIVDAAYQVFVESVAANRGKSYDYADKTMADGQEFVGQAAVDVGLVDGITTFDAVMGDLKEKSIDPSNKFMDNRGKAGSGFAGASTTQFSGEATMGKKALTEQDIAALAAGAAVEAKSEAAGQDDAQAAVDAGAEAGAGEAHVEANVEGQGAAQAEVTGQEVDKTSATVQLLNEQLRAKEESLIQAHIKIAKLEEQAAEANASHAPLLDIAAKSVSNMLIALGGSALNLEGMSATQVLAEHKRASEQFQSKFKIGGVAAVSSDNAAESKTQIDPRHHARVAAARFQKK